MKSFDLRRYIARETAIGVLVNVLVATAPSLMFLDVAAATVSRPVREVAISSTPQFFMAALMSALVPSLLLCRKHARGRLGITSSMPRLRPDRAAVIATGLAAAFTILALAAIHIVVAPLAQGGMGGGAVLALRVTQAALAAATLTPVAILLLFGDARHAQR